MGGEVKDECGIAAASVKDNGNSSNRALFYIYKMLLNLQNRGQLSAGVTTYNKDRPNLLATYKDLGSVNEVFKTSSKEKSMEIFKKYSGNRGIGHVRYATCGMDGKEYAQPFERPHGRKWKWFSFCFNGNLANYQELKQALMDKVDYHIILDTDTEIIMHYIARELKGGTKPRIENVFSNLSNKFDGAYNIAFANAFGDIAVARDPMGFRPLCYGSNEKAFLVASESNALINCGVHNFKSLEPGQMIHVHNGNIEIKQYAKCRKKSYCMFEWVYFANVSSVINDKSVYITRSNLGKEMAKQETEKITKDHIVVPVPDTAKAAGDAMAYELGIPAKEGLIRNRYVGRTFIEGIGGRSNLVENKYTALPSILQGKKVLLVDDSIVRGATSKQLVKYIKEVGGAKEVHLRVSCPPIMAPCFYGIDMSTIGELMAPRYGRNTKDQISEKVCQKIAEYLGADSLIYQTIPRLVNAIGLPKSELCMACLNGDYPTPCGKVLYKQALDKFNKGIKEDKRSYEA